MKKPSNSNSSDQVPGRIVGFDCHPDHFTAAFLVGETPATAQLQKTSQKQPVSRLAKWAQDNTTPEDCIVLEASGNSFFVTRQLRSLGRRALVLESRRLGKLKEAHANNDQISAERIGRAYLCGTASEVWVPDPQTQELRDIFLAYKKAVKRCTQMKNRIRSYLSDHGVRTKSIDLQQVLDAYPWKKMEEQVLRGLFQELKQAEDMCNHWERVVAQCVLKDKQMLSLVRQCGIRHITAFALRAVIGDISRFKSPAALVNYVKLSPGFDDSGNNSSVGTVGRVGRADLRSLLIQGAQAVIHSNHSLGKFGKKLILQKNKSPNVAVVAVARKMLVAVWYLMNGKWTTLEEIDKSLSLKVGKIILASGIPRKERGHEKEQALKKMLQSRVIDPKAFETAPSAPVDLLGKSYRRCRQVDADKAEEQNTG